MIENFGGIINFLAVLLPAVMALYYGYRCLFASDAFIEQYGLGAASGFMVKLVGTYTITQAIMYFILILTNHIYPFFRFCTTRKNIIEIANSDFLTPNFPKCSMTFSIFLNPPGTPGMCPEGF